MNTPDNASDFNNDHVENCDVCDSRQMGTEYYCNDAMGMATPVLWVCHRCENPPVLVKWYRKAKWAVTFYGNKARYILTTTKAQRKARRDSFKAKVAKINERRIARGEKPIGAAS